MIKETSRLFLQQKEEFMKKYISILKRTQLFAGVMDDEIASMLNCLGAKLYTYKKGEYVFRQGEHIEHITTCASSCRIHTIVVRNLFFAISEKNRELIQKLGHMSKRSTREKLISYLSDEAKRQKSGTFMIPFNRQQLADFLSVDRSAMSNELCKMRDEGLLIFNKNQFTLL